MDKRNLKIEYQSVCERLGFDVPQCDEFLKAYRDKDDYQLNILSPLKDDWEAQELFMDAYLMFLRDPDNYKRIYT